MTEQSLRFAHTEMFYWLFGIIVFIAIYLIQYVRTKRKLRALGDEHLLPVLLPNYSKSKQFTKFILLIAVYILLVIALARPQYGTKQEEVTKRGIEVVICVDVSNSMLAQDITPNRIENAKLSIQRILKNLDEDKVGIVIFAGDAYVQMPLTTDIAAAYMFLQNINTNTLSKQGTAIGAAIVKAMQSFTDNPKTSKAIIVISDGENHEDNAVDMASKAHANNIIVHTVGMGGIQGVPIPLSNSNQFLKDNKGNVVVTTLNEAMLQEIAKAGKGIYTREDFQPIVQQLDTMSKTDFSAQQFSKYNEQFMFFAILAFVILFLESVMVERKNKWFQNLDIFTIKKNKND